MSWVDEAITPNLITAVITKNVPLMAAAMLALGIEKPIITPDEKEYEILDKIF
jgi:hypothetical protein